MVPIVLPVVNEAKSSLGGALVASRPTDPAVEPDSEADVESSGDEVEKAVELMSLGEALERIDPRLRDEMEVRLRAQFREVVRWEEPASVGQAQPVDAEPDASEV